MATEGGHGAGANSLVMHNPDGTAMTKRQVIKKRRGAFKWLPVACSNDLVHGSWWMVIGSFGCTIFAVIPLVQQYESFYKSHDDLLPKVDFQITWALLIFSGFFFTLGSFAFVRAFGEPPQRALLYFNRHFRTDELLGAWLFLFGTIPAVPYTLVYFLLDPTFTYLGALSSSGVFVLGTVVFVLACYPTGKNHKNVVLPFLLRYCGARMWMVKHLANDWLAGTWFFLWANAIFTFFSFLLLFSAIASGDPNQIFMWLSSCVNSFFFLIGSFYYVSGSYPHAQQFYYAIDRGVGGTLTYDAPANLPDYSDASDDVEVEHMFFSSENVDRKKLGKIGTIDLENANSHTGFSNSTKKGSEKDVISPLHTNAKLKSGSEKILDETEQPIVKSVLTHEIDDNHEDDDDDIDHELESKNKNIVFSPLQSQTLPSYAPPPVPSHSHP